MISQTVINKISKTYDSIRKKNRSYKDRFLKGGEAAVIKEMENQIIKGDADIETIRCFVDLMLIADNLKVFKKYDLKIIETLLEVLCKYFPLDLDINMEYYYFLFNVLDKEKKAAKHLSAFSKRVEGKIKPNR